MRYPARLTWKTVKVDLLQVKRIYLYTVSSTDDEGNTSTDTHVALDVVGNPAVQLDCIPGLDIKRAIYVMKRNAPRIVDETGGYYN